MKKQQLNDAEYAALLRAALPRVIETRAENRRVLAVLWEFMKKGEENWTPEDATLVGLLLLLVLDYEERRFARFRQKVKNDKTPYVSTTEEELDRLVRQAIREGRAKRKPGKMKGKR